ncbi:MAG: M20/M25/M40 family metallo-hydrolase [Clostridia bacterium]|nr:M20/M25/M40 family metallo-hydrolase [Clostridia bacterium]
MMYETLKKLCEVQGISGREDAVSKVIEGMIAPYADTVEKDAMGNLIACVKGTAPKAKVMFAAHMDEIGFLVNFIDDNGFIRFAPIGGINVQAALYSQVVFANGVKGIMLPDVGTAKEPKLSTCYEDIGAKNKKEAQARVSIGDAFALKGNLKALTRSVWAGRPLDNRAGCAVLVEAMAKLRQTPPKDDIYFVFSSQEEVGCRGAKTAAFAIDPDFGFSVDVTGTGDTPGASTMAVKQGEGVAIKIKDSSVICDTKVVKVMETLAKENGIPYQREVLLYGGTDASSMQVSGIGAYVGGISIPSRGIHSGTESASKKDLLACVDLTVALATASLYDLTGYQN